MSITVHEPSSLKLGRETRESDTQPFCDLLQRASERQDHDQFLQSTSTPSVIAGIQPRKRQKAVVFADISASDPASKVLNSTSRRSHRPFPGSVNSDDNPQKVLTVPQSSNDRLLSQSEAYENRPGRVQRQAGSSLAVKPDLPLSTPRIKMFNVAKGRDTRRDRTFVGCNCAVCEEPLEHTLRGERILQLTCGHVSHEACFYEYIKEFEVETCPDCEAPLGLDTSRGGNIDFENLNRLVRSVKTPDLLSRPRGSEPWDTETIRIGLRSDSRNYHHNHRPTREHLLPGQAQSSAHQRNQSGRYDQQYSQTESVATTQQYSDVTDHRNHGDYRRDYDAQSIDTSVSAPHDMIRNPVPSPTITIRSEFPTITRSNQQQSLTCLVTVEVLDSKWRPHADDLKTHPSMPPTVVEQASTPEHPKANIRTAVAVELDAPVDSVHEAGHELEAIKDDLIKRVDNWHGLDHGRFGRLLLHGRIRVGKDRKTWQDLDCYLFVEMLICVKQKRVATDVQPWDESPAPTMKIKSALKGSILIKKHLTSVEIIPDEDVLTLGLTVAELPAFHLKFSDRRQLEIWREVLLNMNMQENSSETFSPSTENGRYPPAASHEREHNVSEPAPERWSSPVRSPSPQIRPPSAMMPSRLALHNYRTPKSSSHVPVDVVVVIPASQSMHGLKIDLLRDSLRFLVSHLGDKDRMALVSFGSADGGIPLVSLANKHWAGWTKVIDSIRSGGRKAVRSDVIEGANVAVDLLMQRKWANSISHVILISDCSSSDSEAVDFVISRAEAAKIAIHSFGLGLAHHPDILVELSARTKAGYVFVKDWMMLRECLAGCLGSIQSTSHQNAKLNLVLPSGSPAKIVKISGAIQTMKRSSGREAEASLGDLRFGDKRDILVQLAIEPDNPNAEPLPADHWDNLVSGLKAFGTADTDSASRVPSIEEIPLLQADLNWGNILRDGQHSQLPRPSLLTITLLPGPSQHGRASPSIDTTIPPHPSIVQRRMELLTSDMLSRSLSLAAKAQHERASHILSETRTILKGLGKGGLPPLPFPPPSTALPSTPSESENHPRSSNHPFQARTPLTRTPSPPHGAMRLPLAMGMESKLLAALDADLEASLEYIMHPVVFARDSRKAMLQVISVISSQRAVTFRTPSESLYAGRIAGIRRLAGRSREWREMAEEVAA